MAIGTIDTSDPTNATYHGGPDGQFGYNTDTFYFFAQGPSGWASEFDPAYPDTIYLDHPYELKNYYYLTVARTGAEVGGTPKRITTRLDGAPTGGATVVAHVPRPRALSSRTSSTGPTPRRSAARCFWEKWFWASMTPGGGFDFTVDLPGADTTQRRAVPAAPVGHHRQSRRASTPRPAASVQRPATTSSTSTFNTVTFPRRGWNGYMA